MEPPALPKTCDLSPYQLGFLDQHFKSLQDVNTASNLLNSLNNCCADVDTHLFCLQTNLTKRVVSWISRSFPAKTSLHQLSFNLPTSQYGIGSKKTEQILFELAQFAEELRRIQNIQKYVDTSLELEALVGDLEDVAYGAVNQASGSVFSDKLLNSSLTRDLQSKNERLFQASKVLDGIEEILVRVAKFQPQWHHLLKSVDIRIDKSLSVLRLQVFADHRILLASIGWPPRLLTSKTGSGDISSIPNPLVLMQGSKRECYCQSALALCGLQRLQTQREKRQLHLFEQELDTAVWAIDELVSPFASRIEYHLLRWIAEPEYIFALLYKITRDLVTGVDDVLGPLIDKARLRSYGAKEAWVAAMVQMLSKFLAKRVFPALVGRYKEKHERSEVMASWLHLIDLIIAFDGMMQSLLNLENRLFFKDTEVCEGLSKCVSILMIFSDRPDWLKVWEKIELKNAWKKLKAELKDERAWFIDNICNFDLHIQEESEKFLLSSREHHKSPAIAESAITFAREMIERCLNFPAIVPRVHFIRSTTVKFLWHFFNVLLLRCKRTELYLCNPDDEILMTICGSINAARYVESKLLEWSDDVNFVEMTAAENYCNIHKMNWVTDNSCFFGEEIKSLIELETSWLMEVIATLLRQFESLSWGYVQNNDRFEQERQNFTTENVSIETDLVASIDLVESLDALRRQLNTCKMGLNPKDFSDLWRSVAEGLDHFILCSIFTGKIKFSSSGIKLFGADMEALFLVFKPFCARPNAFFPCIGESLELLTIRKGEVKQLQVVLCNDKNGTNYLHSLGISHLSLDKVDKILSSRKL